MQKIKISVEGIVLDFDHAKKVAETICKTQTEDTFLISWNDKLRNLHSPCCLKCEIKGTPAWEKYGISHGGRFRISINSDDYVFIFG